VREAPVEHNRIVGGDTRHLIAVFARVRDVDDEALFAQALGQQLGRPPVVVDNQDPHGDGTSIRSRNQNASYEA